MGYWKSKILPKIKKILNMTTSASNKSDAPDEAINSFHHSKEQLNEQFEQRKAELQPKVLQIYHALPPEMKALIKEGEPKESDLNNNSGSILQFLQDLASIEFPGSKAVWEACSDFGPASKAVMNPVMFILDKVSKLTLREAGEADQGAPSTHEIPTDPKEKDLLVES